MASWHYAFLFPGVGESLKPANAVGVLSNNGLEFDDVIRLAVAIDHEGHLEYGEEIVLDGNIHEELCERLGDGAQFQSECRNKELYLSCCFATQYSNPYIMLGWSRRLFAALSATRQQAYWKILSTLAKQCNATYVIIVNYPPDFFEDRFLEIDGQRILETEMPSGRQYDIRAVWVNAESSDDLPEGIGQSPRRSIEEGFLEFSALLNLY